MLTAVRMRRCVQARSAWKVLNRPIFIPEDDTEAISLLIKGDVANLAALLTRRISLGSDSAAALLGYLEFMGAISGVSNPDAAIALCTPGARKGHGYAQYVLAWAQWESAETVRDALRWMKRSAADSKFLPAWVGLAQMLSMSATSKSEARAALDCGRVAHKLGHAAALLLICGIARGGRLGWAWRLGCALAFPFCLLRTWIFWKCHPFSERSLVTLKNPKVPFLQPGGARS
jgi:hypothetical protein